MLISLQLLPNAYLLSLFSLLLELLRYSKQRHRNHAGPCPQLALSPCWPLSHLCTSPPLCRWLLAYAVQCLPGVSCHCLWSMVTWPLPSPRAPTTGASGPLGACEYGNKICVCSASIAGHPRDPVSAGWHFGFGTGCKIEFPLYFSLYKLD